MKCNNCGKENSEGASFCSGCGTKLEAPIVQEQVVVQEQPAQTVVPQQQPITPAPVQQSTGMPGWQKGIILGLLGVLIFGLIIVIVVIALVKPNGGKININKDDSRTVMIYIDGSNLEYDAGIVTSELEAIDPSRIDLEHTNVLIYTGGTKKWHNFISNNENAIYKLTANGFEKLESQQKKNMGDPSTLSDFITYCYNNYKAGHYELILYNHGGAIDGAIYDDFTNDNLTLEDLNTALDKSPFNKDNKMEAVIFRTCLNGTLEVASIFDDYAEYIVFSEEVTLGSGRSNVLGYFLNDLSPSADGIAVGNKFIDAYNKQMEDIDVLGVRAVTYSIVDLSKVDNVIKELDKYIQTLDLKNNYKEISTIRVGLYQYGIDVPDYDMVDLAAFVSQSSKYSSGSADNLLKAIDDAVIRNNTNLDNANGLSVYFPYNGRAAIINRFMKVYDKLDFSKNYQSFIKSYYNAKQETKPFNFDISKNEEKVVDGEVELQLTDEQKGNIVWGSYFVFRQEERYPGYYRIVYKSNNLTIGDNSVHTNFANKLIKVSEEGDSTGEYVAVVDAVYDNNRKVSIPGTLIDKDEDVLNYEKYTVYGNIMVEDDNGTPKLGKLEVSTRDERVQGILYDIDKYEKLSIMFSSPKIVDSKGKLIPNNEWTYPNTRYGVETDLDKTKLEYAGLDDGNFYVLIYLYDYNNHEYVSNLIKVGK